MEEFLDYDKNKNEFICKICGFKAVLKASIISHIATCYDAAMFESIDRCRVPNCNGEYRFRNFCGAYVCDECGDHKGLAKCYCGWNLAPGERLDDDVDDY